MKNNRYSIQNDSCLNNPVTNTPIIGSRIYDGDTVLGEWYDTGNEIMAQKIVDALNLYEKEKRISR
jgi:hypothetical protein